MIKKFFASLALVAALATPALACESLAQVDKTVQEQVAEPKAFTISAEQEARLRTALGAPDNLKFVVYVDKDGDYLVVGFVDGCYAGHVWLSADEFKQKAG